jgi:hypothetical protein
MPGRPALRRVAAASLIALVSCAAAGCAQPGTQAPKPEAAKLSVATGDISLACGYAEELTAFAGPHAAGLRTQDSMAVVGARRLLDVWSRSRTWIYQGETINGVVTDSISLLGDCGLHEAQRFLQSAISRRGRG